MIDNPDQTGRLFAKLQAALPVPARMTPELAATLQSGAAVIPISSICSITSISYAGDEGGVMGQLDLKNETGNAIYVSITHLRFDPRLPAARDITAYQNAYSDDAARVFQPSSAHRSNLMPPTIPI